KAVPRERVTEKRVKHDGQTETWTYQINLENSTTIGPDGSTVKEYFCPTDPADAQYIGGTEGRNGLTYRIERYGTGTTSKVIVEKKWNSKIFDGAHTKSPGGKVVFNPVVEAEYTTLVENGVLIKMSAKKFQYDFNGNVTQVTEYDWFDPNLVSRDSAGIPID